MWIQKVASSPRRFNQFWLISGKTTISNDGATILKLLDIVYPSATILADIAKSQDAEVGDGTTSGRSIAFSFATFVWWLTPILVVVLAAELLKNAKQFIEDGVNAQLIIRAYTQASREAINKLHELSVRLTGENELYEMLIKCAATTLSSKLVGSTSIPRSF